MSLNQNIQKLRQWIKDEKRWRNDAAQLVANLRRSPFAINNQHLKSYGFLYAELSMLECSGEVLVDKIGKQLQEIPLSQEALPSELKEAMRSIQCDDLCKKNPDFDTIGHILDNSLKALRELHYGSRDRAAIYWEDDGPVELLLEDGVITGTEKVMIRLGGPSEDDFLPRNDSSSV